MVEKKNVKATIKTAAQVVQLAGVEAEAKPAVPGKIEVKAEVAVPVKIEAAPVEKEAEAAPVERTTARKTASKIVVKRAATPKGIVKKEAAPKAEAKRETAPKVAKKEAMKKIPARKAVEPKIGVHSQSDGEDLVTEDVLDQAVRAFKKTHRGVEAKTISLYVVANEGVAYYVVNDEGGDDYKIVL